MADVFCLVPAADGLVTGACCSLRTSSVSISCMPYRSTLRIVLGSCEELKAEQLLVPAAPHQMPFRTSARSPRPWEKKKPAVLEPALVSR